MKDIFEKTRERRLAKRMAQGETRAFEEFVDKYGESLHRLARSNVRTISDAEDLTQEIMIAIARSIATFRGDSTLKTWATRIALNHCIKHRERRAEQAESLQIIAELRDTADSPATLAEYSELCEHLDGALCKLSNDHRVVVVLHEIQGLTYSECAGVLGIPIGTVKSRLSNAFRGLRTSLRGYVLGEDGLVLDTQQACANTFGAETEG